MYIDVKKDLCFVNVGEESSRSRKMYPREICTFRNWENSRKLGFISARQGRNWSKQLERLQVNDIVAAYVTEKGYVGIGIVTEKPIKIRDFKIDNDSTLKSQNLYSTNIFINENSDDKCEYCVRINWFEGKTVNREDGFWETRIPRLYSTQLITASLKNQQETIKFLRESFKITFNFLK